MAGLLNRLARQLLKTKPQNQSRPIQRTASKAVTRPVADTKVNVIDRTIRRERTGEEVAREDFLLNQIDEFREKAQKLQDLLLSKESKVEELQTIVDEKEGKAKQLQNILDERQKQADVITEEMNQQIDKLIEKVTAKMSDIEASLGENLADNNKKNEEQTLQIKESLEALTSQLEALKADLSDYYISLVYDAIAPELFDEYMDTEIMTEERLLHFYKKTQNEKYLNKLKEQLLSIQKIDFVSEWLWDEDLFALLNNDEINHILGAITYPNSKKEKKLDLFS